MRTLASIQSEDGWEAFIRGMHAAFATDVGELIAIGVIALFLALFAINMKVARRLEQREQR